MQRAGFTYRLRSRLFLTFAVICVLAAGIFAGRHVSRRLALHDKLIEMGSFRDMQVQAELLEEVWGLKQENGITTGRLLALAFAGNGGSFPKHMPNFSSLEKTAKWVYKWCPGEYELLENAFCAVWDDIECFPVKCRVSYEDSWMAKRTYGGERGHEGTDLMPPVDQSGFYPVFSVTAGVVEKMGWLEKGGYRVGIRSPHGGYFYYAHLSEYEEGLCEGDEVEAGQLLGYMGDTGYGPEGTTGQFEVHLHFGIYIQTPEKQEISVNPYWVLRELERRG